MITTVCPATLKIVGPRDGRAWDCFVDEHPKGSIFHTAAMFRVYQATKNYEPWAFCAIGDTGELLAMLVAVRVQTLSVPDAGLASRSILYAEPLCRDSDEGIEALAALLHKHDRYMRRRALFAEVRPLHAAGAERVALEKCGYEYEEYLNYLVDLRQPPEILFGKMGRSCRRRVRRAETVGVQIEDINTERDVDVLYGLVKQSYARSRVPVADISLFRAAQRLLPVERLQSWVARHEGQAVAAGNCLIYKDRVFAWYAGAERVPKISPFALLTWREIERGAKHGLGVYDFGGAGSPDKPYGPREFKAHFGGELVNYGRYRKVFAPWKLKLAEGAYAMARGFVAPAQSTDAD